MEHRGQMMESNPTDPTRCMKCDGNTYKSAQIIRGYHAAKAIYPVVSWNDLPIKARWRVCTMCGEKRKLPMEIVADS